MDLGDQQLGVNLTDLRGVTVIVGTVVDVGGIIVADLLADCQTGRIPAWVNRPLNLRARS
jgi:hypothetical protein